MVTPRRLITLALLLSAVVLSVVGLQSVRDTRAATCSHGVILKLYPCPGDTDLRQGTIGVDMASGWQADLYLDNNAIPKDQLEITGSSYYYGPRRLLPDPRRRGDGAAVRVELQDELRG